MREWKGTMSSLALWCAGSRSEKRVCRSSISAMPRGRGGKEGGREGGMVVSLKVRRYKKSGRERGRDVPATKTKATSPGATSEASILTQMVIIFSSKAGLAPKAPPPRRTSVSTKVDRDRSFWRKGQKPRRSSK
jgi:hypothetical protein